ncbi:RHS repeat-associated core domain-containing protein [Sorangium sp. So ce1389]|uniref:RHS repeat-associated core domain-containing protein n=1 Tax=Sorangium sp. So ce1389 TaxID=3133336 RepID=UPI003F5EC2D4
MNPGVFVMGGGGGGGGSGGRGGRGGKGKQGAGGKNGGRRARGGGRDARSCGPGSGGGCSNPAHGGRGTHAGDPIDPVTGRAYTVAVADLSLPGPLPLILERAYSSSAAGEDVGLGFGWKHSLAWSIVETRTEVRVVEPFGTPTIVEKPELDEALPLPCGRLRRLEHGYVLERDDNLYIFRLEDARNGRYRLSRITDANGSAIELLYGDAGLSAVVDSAGRLVRVRRHAGGRIAAFEVKNAKSQGQWIAFRHYAYDDAGNLSAAIDARGHAERFAYDEDHRLISRLTAAGLSTEFRYDSAGRCVESWCHRVRGEAGLDPDVPAMLADGCTQARGFLHVKVDYYDGFSEVVASRTIRRVHGNDLGMTDKLVSGGGVHTQVFDDMGQLLSYTDASGGEWRWERDERGALVRTVNPLGHTNEYRYDERGFLEQAWDALGGFARYTRDERGNVLSIDDDAGNVATLRYDARGLLVEAMLPNGGTTALAYDDQGNRTAIVEPDGATRRLYYDYLGRIQCIVDERGLGTWLSYDECGNLRGVRGPTGDTAFYEYDEDGEIVRMVDEDGRSTVFVRGGFNVVIGVVRPDGTQVRYLYDREQELVRIVNEAGDEHRFERNGEGRIVTEHTFDGRTMSYRYDFQGRVTRIDYGEGEFVELEYDAIGRLTTRSYSDDRVDRFEYDAVGRLVSAENGDVACTYTYGPRGDVTRQTTAYAGDVHLVESTFDALGARTGMTSRWSAERRGATPPAELAIRMTRDVVGRALRVWHGPTAPIELQYDPYGTESLRVLPQGGRIETEIRQDRALSRVSVRRPWSGRAVGPGEPMWVGSLQGDETLRRSFAWSPSGYLLWVDDAGSGRTEMSYDANGRVVAERPSNGAPTLLRYGPSGDLDEPTASGPRRRYGKGGRLLERDGIVMRYDGRGRLVNKRVPGPGGSTSAWTFSWAANGLLAAVVSPAGERTEFVYDPFGRRIEKRTRRGNDVFSRTRYAWDGETVLRSAEERLDVAGAVVSRTRDYLQLPDSLIPLAQRVCTGEEEGHWEYFLSNHTTLHPEALLDGNGEVLARVGASLHGKVDQAKAHLTEVRLPGQLADSETGLHYNRYRYYDPDTASFISPEPIGIEGSLLTYAYADNMPLRGVDPDGLAVVRSTVRGVGGDGRPISTSVDASGSNVNRPLHPAVAAALPVHNARGRYQSTGMEHPITQCGDPHAFSDYIRAWENSHTPPRRCDPATARGRRNLRNALRSVDSFESNQIGKGAGPRAPCPNCSQTISRLHALAGLPPPRSQRTGPMQPGQRVAPRGQRATRGTYEDPQGDSDLAAVMRGGPGADPRQPNRARYEEAVQQMGWQNPGRAENIPEAGAYRYDNPSPRRNSQGRWRRV